MKTSPLKYIEQPVLCNKSIIEVCKNSLQLRWGMEILLEGQRPISDTPVIIENITYSGNSNNITATITLSEDIDNLLSKNMDVSFHGDRNLNFDPSRKITGLNVIDKMIYWTDNHSEPKKVNIERGKIGSRSAIYGAGFDGSLASPTPYTWSGNGGINNGCLQGNPVEDWACFSDFDQHTKLIVKESHVMECEKATASCEVLGCTDPNSINYNPSATVDDGSCVLPLPTVYGCDDGTFGVDNLVNGACNAGMLFWGAAATGGQYDYNSNDTNLCVFEDECTICEKDPVTQLNTGALVPDPNCAACTDPAATINYDPSATVDCAGADITASNYTQVPGLWNSCCDYPVIPIPGCMDPSALNYDCATAINPNSTTPCSDGVTVDDGSCLACIPGCTDPLASNYNANAQCDDGSCQWTGSVCGNCNFTSEYDTAFGAIQTWTGDSSKAEISFQHHENWGPHAPNVGQTWSSSALAAQWSQPINWDPQLVEYWSTKDIQRWNLKSTDEQGWIDWPYNIEPTSDSFPPGTAYNNEYTSWGRFAKLQWIGVIMKQTHHANDFGIWEISPPSGWPISGGIAPVWDVSNPLIEALEYLAANVHNCQNCNGVPPNTQVTSVDSSNNPASFIVNQPNNIGPPSTMNWTVSGILTYPRHQSPASVGLASYRDFIVYINAAIERCASTTAGSAYLASADAYVNETTFLQFDVTQDYATVKRQFDCLLNKTKKPYTGQTYNLGYKASMGGIDHAAYKAQQATNFGVDSAGNTIPWSPTGALGTGQQISNWEAGDTLGLYAAQFTSGETYAEKYFPYALAPQVAFSMQDCICGYSQYMGSGSPEFCNDGDNYGSIIDPFTGILTPSHDQNINVGDPGYNPNINDEPPCDGNDNPINNDNPGLGDG